MINNIIGQTKVSVYIPTHNRANLLKKAVQSVLGQSYKDIEIIIVDDGSTDHTSLVIAQLQKQNNNIIVLRNETPKGAAFSRNLAIKNASGYFITGLDDDDQFLPNRIRDFIEHSNDDYGSFLFTNYSEFDGRVITKNLPRKLNITFVDIKKRNYIGNQIFITRSKLMRSNCFDEKLLAWEDYDLWFRLINKFGTAKVINNHSYLLNTENNRLRITNSSNITLAAEQFIEKHQNSLSKKEINYHKINVLYDKKSPIKLSLSLYYCQDWYSTIRFLKAYLASTNSSVLKKISRTFTTLVNLINVKN